MYKLFAVIGISLVGSWLVTSCITPDLWSASDHQQMMQKCRIMCGEHRVRFYEPVTAE